MISSRFHSYDPDLQGFRRGTLHTSFGQLPSIQQEQKIQAFERNSLAEEPYPGKSLRFLNALDPGALREGLKKERLIGLEQSGSTEQKSKKSIDEADIVEILQLVEQALGLMTISPKTAAAKLLKAQAKINGLIKELNRPNDTELQPEPGAPKNIEALMLLRKIEALIFQTLRDILGNHLSDQDIRDLAGSESPGTKDLLVPQGIDNAAGLASLSEMAATPASDQAIKAGEAGGILANREVHAMDSAQAVERRKVFEGMLFDRDKTADSARNQDSSKEKTLQQIALSKVKYVVQNLLNQARGLVGDRQDNQGYRAFNLSRALKILESAELLDALASAAADQQGQSTTGGESLGEIRMLQSLIAQKLEPRPQPIF